MPLFQESVQPKPYGGTERAFSYLTEEYVRRGHEMTLFASGDSITRAKLRRACPRALRFEGANVGDSLALHLQMVEMVARHAREFELVHFHIDHLHFSVARRDRIPALGTSVSRCSYRND